MSSPRTLYADWTVRRAALAGRETEHTSQTVARVLDFLLRRYRDAPEGEALVCAPPRHELCVNDRALLIHAHLGSDQGRFVRSSGSAARRIQGVLARMTAGPSRGTGELPAPTTPPAGPSAEGARLAREQRLRMLLGDIDERMEGLWMIWLAGDLLDVGVVCDLLELPFPADEGPEERAAMLWLLGHLSGEQPATEGLFFAGSLYTNWRMRHAHLARGWGAGPETPEVYALLGQLLERYRESELTRRPTFAPNHRPGDPSPRQAIIAAYTARPVRAPKANLDFSAWLALWTDRGVPLDLAPLEDRQYWANAQRQLLLSPSDSDRVGALSNLTLVGDLNDVGLMCDLLALTNEGQSMWERAAMVALLRNRVEADG